MRIIWLQCISVTPVKERWQIQVTDVTYRTHQVDVDELMAMKADCGVGSPRQPRDPKLPWHTKLTLDTRRPNSTSVLRLSRALVRQLNCQSEWSDGPPDRWAQMPIQHVKSAEKNPTSTNFSQWCGTHRENLVGRRTKTARRPAIGLVYSGVLKHSLIIVYLKTSDKTNSDGSG